MRTPQAFVMMVAALVLLSLLKFVFKDSIPKAKKSTKTAKQVATSTKRSTPLVKEEAAIAYSQLSAAKYLMGAPSDVSLARCAARTVFALLVWGLYVSCSLSLLESSQPHRLM